MLKKLVFILLVASMAVFFISSCSKCITCAIYGHSINSTDLVDNDTILYKEFCGSTSEVNSFKADVKWEAENRRCLLFTIQKINDQTILFQKFVCGGVVEQQKMQSYFDSLLLHAYSNQNAQEVVDSVIPNPGTWKCN
ncbi:MAG: hypothetical protein NTW49_04095 [Bacteroidia bacterium]|nr:hypothetical protein [Bacteroidia bacterium]